MASPPPIDFKKQFDVEYGRIDRLSPLVRRIIANNPGPFTFTGSGVYIVGPENGPVAVIDPGPNLKDHVPTLIGALDGTPVSHVLITHTHQDHCGCAREFADKVGAPIMGYGPHPQSERKPFAGPALEEGGSNTFEPDVLIKDGEKVIGEGWQMTAIHTPGHLSNHLCFALESEKALFCGDHVMGWSTTVVAPPEGDMNDYIASLEILLDRDDEIYYPTHGAPIEAPQKFVRAIRTHRLFRDQQILSALEDGTGSISGLVDKIYVGLDARVKPAAALNVLSHLIRLQKIGKVACNGTPLLDADWQSVQ
ncbi:MAG: MBL fold metallo-hydrolase [Pseudomonadota bacterium]